MKFSLNLYWALPKLSHLALVRITFSFHSWPLTLNQRQVNPTGLRWIRIT